jgi:hypothetical protein
MLEMMAVCGLDCGGCGIRKLPTDSDAAVGVIAWYRRMGWLEEGEGVAEAIERKMYCNGCHADRTVHWSANCWILQCCVDDRGLQYCYECDSFACEKLEEWATQNESYAQALQRLKKMKP